MGRKTNFTTDIFSTGDTSYRRWIHLYRYCRSRARVRMRSLAPCTLERWLTLIADGVNLVSLLQDNRGLKQASMEVRGDAEDILGRVGMRADLCFPCLRQFLAMSVGVGCMVLVAWNE